MKKLKKYSAAERKMAGRLIDASVDGILAFDCEYRYTAWNSAMERISGLRREEVLGRQAFEVFPFLKQTGEDRYFDEALAGRSIVAEARQYSIPETRSSGYFDAYYSPLRNDAGEVEGGIAVVRDITAAREAAKELRASEERYRAFIANSSEGIWRCELEQPVPTDIPEDEQIDLFYRDGYLAECNDAMARMYGFNRAEELMGVRVADLLVRDDPKNEQYLRAFIRSGYRLTDAESVEVDRDGQTRFFLNNLIGLVENGYLLHAWGSQRDLSDRKRAEQEREELLRRERLARSDAEGANRLKDDFLATLSHELRTPVTAILGWAHMLRLGGIGAQVRSHAIEVIERNAQAQTKLIDDILDVSRIVTGKLLLRVRPVELAPLIDAARETVAPAAAAKGIRIETAYDATDLAVPGDPDRLQQVLWNLLANAVKFTPPGGRVSIGLTRAGEYAEITIDDTGEGIAAEFLPHVFDHFRQADMGVTRRHGGLGLGLAIVRRLVEMHGGTVTARSAGTGYGATFTVQLPLLRPGESAEPRTKISPPTQKDQTARKVSLEGLRLLVVEDEPDSLELLGIALSSYGAEVTTSNNAADALDFIAKSPPDVLISDVGMPYMDGYELIRRVRSLEAEKGPRLPAIALTAYARDEDRTRALEAGFLEHVTKPVDPARLARIVADLVEGRQGLHSVS